MTYENRRPEKGDWVVWTRKGGRETLCRVMSDAIGGWNYRLNILEGPRAGMTHEPVKRAAIRLWDFKPLGHHNDTGEN